LGIIKQFKKDKLEVKIYKTRAEMGISAAREASKVLKKMLLEKDEITIIFAAAPSQNEFLESISQDSGIDWERINALHMDEYIGLSKDAPQGFGNFLKRTIFDKIPLKSVHYLDGNAKDIEAECKRYSKLIEEMRPDVVFMGIGENGHIAFNDPPVADFRDDKLVKVVELDLMCRNQQVNDGCFQSLSDVPTHALTLTIPALMNAKYHFCVVPAKTKAQAVLNTINDEISEGCPASILRMYDNCVLYLDSDSGQKLLDH